MAAGNMSQRKRLLLLVFVWTCLCLVILKTSFLTSRDAPELPYGDGAGDGDGDGEAAGAGPNAGRQATKLRARAATSLRPLADEGLAASSPASRQLGSPLDSIDPMDGGQRQRLAPGNPLYYEVASAGTAAANRLNVIESATAISESSSGGGDGVSGNNGANGANGGARPAISSADANANHRADSNRRQHPDREPKPQLETSAPGPNHHLKQHTNEPKRQRQHKTHSAGEQAAAPGLAGANCHYDYPNLADLRFNNIYWQTLTVAAGTNSSSPAQAPSARAPLVRRRLTEATYYLYSAYYDDRKRAAQASVRLLAMIDRVQPPPTNCLLWSSKLAAAGPGVASGPARPQPLVTRAQFVYAWYPKWGNYEDGLLQPWIVTCPLPRDRPGLVPDSVSLVGVPAELAPAPDGLGARSKRNSGDQSSASVSISMPPSYSSSSSSPSSSPSLEDEAAARPTTRAAAGPDTTKPMRTIEYDCQAQLPVTNNIPVLNRRPAAGAKPDKFAVCVKGLDFPYEDVSVRLVEWIELLHLLGAKKIFLYSLSVHENVSRVLDYYQRRGIVELSQLTLPGEQPNLPDYQHLYLKQRLTSKRQNELIPYNDCLYRNLYSYKYLALLDIDEIIMPLKRGHANWYDLMEEVERVSLSEQNYSRASYNVRNVYFFDDLSGPLGTTQSVLGSAGPDQGGSSASSVSLTGPEVGLDNGNNTDNDDSDNDDDDSVSVSENEHDDADGDGHDGARKSAGHRQRDSLERGIPHYLHMMSHVYRSKNYTEPGQYVKCFHNTERVVSLHNHFPMNCFGQCTTYSIPVDLAHLQHYRKDCVGPLRQSCKNNFRQFTTRDTTIWRYKQRVIRRTTRVLARLGLLSGQAAAPTSTTVALE